MDTFTVPGPGGGGKDTSKTGVRLTHHASGAVGTGRETRSVTINRRAAFIHLVATDEFKRWHRAECARRLGKTVPETPDEIRARVNREIDEALVNGDILVEEI